MNTVGLRLAGPGRPLVPVAACHEGLPLLGHQEELYSNVPVLQYTTEFDVCLFVERRSM